MRIRDWLRPRRTLVLFVGVLGVLVAGAVWLGSSLLRQDRALAEQRIREQLDSGADLVAAELRAGLSDLAQRLDAMAARPGDDIPGDAAAVLRALTPGVVIARLEPDGLAAFPTGSTLYYPTLPSDRDQTGELFAAAEALELNGRHRQAAASYEPLIENADPHVRAGALLRLARVHRRLGQWQEAYDAYGALVSLDDTPVGGLPAGLLARWARCVLLEDAGRLTDLHDEARLLHDGLMSGRWTIDRPTFLLYREDAETYLAQAGAASNDDEAEPSSSSANRQSVADGLEALWEEWTRGSASGTLALATNPAPGSVIIWRGTPDQAVAFILPPLAARAQLLDPLAPLLERHGAVLHLGARPNGATRTLQVRRTVAETSLPWELQLVSADPAGDEARLAGRRRLLVSVLALVVVLVATGTWFSSRAIGRELEVARMQAELVSAVSHDFRTPLTSLRQVTDALLAGRVAEDRRDAYYEIQSRGIDRLHHLVEGLLDFRRMEAGGREFDRQPLGARPWIEGVVRDFQQDVGKQSYTVELSWTGPDGDVVGDEPALTRALWNVLDNAVKYSPDCRTVWVDCRQNGDHRRTLAIDVRDRGLGIDPGECEDIFSRFTRGTAAARSRSSGTGLGLALVKHIVEAHEGTVEARCGREGGTTMTIRLPMRADP